jgi:cell division FtsZ-interacting protein ZapD
LILERVYLPPLEEQQEVVRRVEVLFRLADKIEKRVGAATRRADKITKAILAKAFRGKLLPTEAKLAQKEGRDYESASALLERVKAEDEKIASATSDGSLKQSRTSHLPRYRRSRRGSSSAYSLPSLFWFAIRMNGSTFRMDSC